MNVLITGGSGFFGKSILEWLKSQTLPINKVIILSRNPQVLETVFDFKSFGFSVEFLAQSICEPFDVLA